jgi:hypothetical protein
MAMKKFVVTLALLVTGVVFIAPPLIVFLPVLLIGLLLFASPLILAAMTRGRNGGPASDVDSGVQHGQHPTAGTAAR